MNDLDTYIRLQAKIHAYFGYVEDWRVIPIDDRRQHYWHLDENPDGSGEVTYHPDEHVVLSLNTPDDEGAYYQDEIYRQRHLRKWVYRAAEFTMICVDTNTDGNQFLAIFDNAKEV